MTLDRVPLTWRGKGLGCPVLLPFSAASLGAQAQLALSPQCAQLPTDRRGLPSPSVLSLVPRTTLQLPLSLQGCLHRIPRPSSHSSAWIPLPVLLHQDKADFHGRQPALFLPSRVPGHRVLPHSLCQGQSVLQVAQPVPMGGVRRTVGS